ncbi:MAG: DUF4143 domain-containing protein, partial [Kiritimatiellaeota bacterium]|nr:DUF4143 domain-containing protein [Kiritimatiellota bacterium]
CNKLYYWHREAKSSNAEVDYVISMNERIVPLEVKSGKTGTLKSLRLFIDSHQLPLGIKISLSNFSKHENICSIPLYAIGNLFAKSTNKNILNTEYPEAQVEDA